MNDHACAEAVIQTLLHCIDEPDSIKSLYLRNPETDFTRDCKFPFRALINAMLMMDVWPLQKELLHSFDHADDTPTKSVCIRRGSKTSQPTRTVKGSRRKSSKI